MNVSKKKQHTRIVIGRIALAFVCAALIFVYFWSWYVKKQQSKLELKSRYTFSTTIDGSENMQINEIADIWMEEFMKQFTQKYVPRSKTLRSVEIQPSVILDEETNTVLVTFSAALKDTASEFFSSWNGVIYDDRFQCEWVIQYNIDNHFDNTATAYVSQIMSSEAYGISKYNQSLNQNGSGSMEVPSSSNKSLASYEIKNDTLYVTYDGEKMITVPIDVANLPMASTSVSGSTTGNGSGEATTTSTTELKEGSYQISTSMTAFLCGGATVSGKKVPLTLSYSNDKGTNWTTCEIDQIYTADYYYVNFLDENNGVIVCGYDRNENVQESSKIYMTSDGGETWNNVGSGPTTNIIKGVVFLDQNIGYFCYHYVEGMDSNLYMTKDAGKTFSKVKMEAQELDSTAANSETTAAAENATTAADPENSDSKLVWEDVYKEALVPIYDENGILTVYLTQGSNGVYNSGKTAAKYQSTDKGETWKYIGQLEIKAQ